MKIRELLVYSAPCAVILLSFAILVVCSVEGSTSAKRILIWTESTSLSLTVSRLMSFANSSRAWKSYVHREGSTEVLRREVVAGQYANNLHG